MRTVGEHATGIALAAEARRASRGSAESVFLQLLDVGLRDTSILFRLEGSQEIAGNRSRPPAFVVRIRNRRFFDRVVSLGNLGLGESFMDGDFILESGALEDLLVTLARGDLETRLRGDRRLLLQALGIKARNVLRGGTGNVRSHYDRGDDLFEVFLDSTLTYSCGYASREDDSLEQLQSNKLDRICRKLQLGRGDRLLDVGCGYGGLLLHAARHFGCSGVGITVSQRHATAARDRVASEGLADRVDVQLASHREIPRLGRFSRVVSVGMMEHLRRGEYRRFFRLLASALVPGSIGLVHTIGCTAARNRHDPFIQRYVFPGSNQPRLSEITEGCERSGLVVLDVENMVRHYAPTTRRWLERFRKNRPRLDPMRYDERFQRMWEYYLCCGVAGATASDGALFQVLFTNDRALSIPFQRV